MIREVECSLQPRDPYAIALGRLTHSNMILPVAAILSIAFSCSVVVCFVVIYRPRRSKNLDHQFGSVRLGLPPGYPGYGRKSHANCWWAKRFEKRSLGSLAWSSRGRLR
eukprot:g12403.t1